MGLWKRWFGKREALAVTPSDSASAPSEGSAGRATCPFCGGAAAERASPARGYPVWVSQCGAIGSGSPMYPDLDEVADALLAILEVPGSVAGPCVPVGTSAMVSVQRYDIPKSLEQMEHMLRAHGSEMRTSTWNESGHAIHAIWVRRAIA